MMDDGWQMGDGAVVVVVVDLTDDSVLYLVGHDLLFALREKALGVSEDKLIVGEMEKIDEMDMSSSILRGSTEFEFLDRA